MNPYTLYPLTNNRAATSSTGLAGELSIAAYKAVEALSAAWAWIDRRKRRNSAIGELSRLSDHMLEDIGISRGEIRDVVEAMLDAPAPRPAGRTPVANARPFAASASPVAANDNRVLTAVAN